MRALAEAAPRLLGTSHRQAPVRGLVGRVREGLGQLLQLPSGYEVVLGNGGATAFWDVATLCLIEQCSQHLVFGEFSGKFAEAAAAAPHLEQPQLLESPPGTHPQPHPDPAVDSFCLTQNETSTGVAMPVRRPGGPEQLVLVDATSAAGGMAIDLEQTDAYYFSPQKCFASEGGLWVAVLSPAALERAERLGVSGRWVPASLDLRLAVQNSRLNQTYNTPSVATLFLLAEQLDWLLGQGGLGWAERRCQESSQIVYGWAEQSSFATPFVSQPEMRSPVVATVDLDSSVAAPEVSRILRQNGVVDTDGYRKLGRNQLRLGLFPAVEPEDVRRLTAAIDWVVDNLSGASGS